MKVPGGMVRSIPGLRAMKSVVVTRRSFWVRTRPMDFAISEYTRKKTRPWKKTDALSVPAFLNEIFTPLVLSSIPGLSARKRTAGMATFWEVSKGSI
tara:strand:- start:1041 stop:1331 length:291 start_codon:yes stop_codon:yes gene_type:complete